MLSPDEKAGVLAAAIIWGAVKGSVLPDTGLVTEVTIVVEPECTPTTLILEVSVI